MGPPATTPPSAVEPLGMDSEMSPALLGASMKRREFIVLVTGATVWARAVRGQQAASVRRIGLLSPFSPTDALLWNKALLRGIRDVGWVDGKNLSIEYRYAAGKKERLPALVSDLVRQKVDIIVTTVRPSHYF